ncbi:MAG: glutathione peroxidase [Hyphomicrobiaceae bacterium]|nr:glutathione peroxidase [Hyphomicrobiaceae bacterium]
MARRIARLLGAIGVGVTISGGEAAAQGSAYDFTFQSIDGQAMPLSEFRGKALLIVNTASFCGFTEQYRALQAVYQKYEAGGLVVIGVPSNDFGGQEPKSEKDVKAFCEGAFGVTFPLTAKYPVRGAAAHPFYRWASETLGAVNGPWWNFHKYLVGRDGKLVAAFGTRTAPDAKDVINAIEAEIAKPVSAADPTMGGGNAG